MLIELLLGAVLGATLATAVLAAHHRSPRMLELLRDMKASEAAWERATPEDWVEMRREMDLGAEAALADMQAEAAERDRAAKRGRP